MRKSVRPAPESASVSASDRGSSDSGSGSDSLSDSLSDSFSVRGPGPWQRPGQRAGGSTAARPPPGRPKTRHRRLSRRQRGPSQPRRHQDTKTRRNHEARPHALSNAEEQRRRGAETSAHPRTQRRKDAKGASAGSGRPSASWRQNGRRSDRLLPVRSGRSPNASVRRRRASHRPPCPGHGGSASRPSPPSVVETVPSPSL